MKAISLIIIVILLPAMAPAMSFWTALAEIESGRNDYAVGDVGEISRYQIRPEVWSVYSASQRYQDPAVALAIAKKYMAKLKRDFERATGHAATESDCVILWKSGIAGYEKQGFNPVRMSAAHQDRMVRFRNLRGEELAATRHVPEQKIATPATVADATKPAGVNIAETYFLVLTSTDKTPSLTFGNPGAVRHTVETEGWFSGVETLMETATAPLSKLCLR